MAAETKGESKKSQKKNKPKEGNSFISGARTYLQEVRTELNKVSWPDRPDVIRLLWIVMAVTVASGLVLGGLSIAFSELIKVGVQFPVVFVVIFAAIIGVTIYMFQRDSQKTGY